MSYLRFPAIAATPVSHRPFDHMLIDCALTPDAAEIDREFPSIENTGSFVASDLQLGGALKSLIAEMNGPAFRELLAAKFDVDLAEKSTAFTLRGACALRDGQIHTDSKTKILSVLLYLNRAWGARGGRLRLLRDAQDIDNFDVEIEPVFGQMLVFRRSERSWHGHLPYVGPRRVLQMNYLTSNRSSLLGELRHRLSALTK